MLGSDFLHLLHLSFKILDLLDRPRTVVPPMSRSSMLWHLGGWPQFANEWDAPEPETEKSPITGGTPTTPSAIGGTSTTPSTTRGISTIPSITGGI